MQDRILQVFYGNDRLPYKDKDRSIHYPITGNTFIGSSNVDKIRFYVRDIGGTNNITWVINAKLPNGSILYQVLSTIALDTELNEYYLEFSVTQFYTQLKGDVYFALNGCDGDVEIETDSETNIQTISATIESQTILTTGVIKFSNNYAPQRPLGFSFELDQYQEIINALSGKSNVANTIQVVANISQADLSGFRFGQLFYDLTTNQYYEKRIDLETGHLYAPYDNGILASEKVVYRFGEILFKTFNDVHDIVDNKMFTVTNMGKEYLCSFEKIISLPTDKYTISALYLNDMSLYQIVDVDLANDFVTLFDTTNKTLYVEQTTSDNRLYGTSNTGAQTTLNYGTSANANYIVQRDANGQINVPITPTQNAHATSKKYIEDNYYTQAQVESYVYGEISNLNTLLQEKIDASGHALSISGGANTDYVYTITLKDNNNNNISIISFDLPLESVVVSGTYDSENQEIVLTLEDGSTIEIPVGDLVAGLVSQSDFDSLSNSVSTLGTESVKYNDITITGGYVAQLQKNGINYPIATNVTLYTTPKVVATTSDLPSENDGYLYLVLANGYLYYWNNGAWTQGYEYVQDVSNFVQTSRTIAGINLANDISAQALTDALVFMNNATDLDYVMED